MSARSDQPRRRATRRAVARANERAVEIGSPRGADCGSIGGAKGFFPLPDGQCWYGRMGVHVPDSRRKLQAAILERTAVKVRKVWRPGRRILACRRPFLYPAMLGSEAEVFRLADEVAKRRRKGQQNPSGVRTSGLRWDEQRHRSAHRGGEPGRRTRVSKAGANA